MKNKRVIKAAFWTIIFALSTFACSQPKPDNNMKWISKYDFFDLYKVRLVDNTFNPGCPPIV